MLAFQIQNDEDPCLDSYRTGQAVIVPDIAADAALRWPRFAAAAREMGFGAVHAIPTRLLDQVIGTMNLFGSAPDGLDPVVAPAARGAGRHRYHRDHTITESCCSCARCCISVPGAAPRSGTAGRSRRPGVGHR
jgi:hypothetical protein